MALAPGFNLQSYVFTNKSNFASNSLGWYLESGGSANALNGNDIIETVGGIYGIYVAGSISTGNGNDRITSNVSQQSQSPGIYPVVFPGFNPGINITIGGIIDTGNGNDSISGSGGITGIENNGVIRTGFGNDAVDGYATFNVTDLVWVLPQDITTYTGGAGIANFDLIDTSNGSDAVNGFGYYYGIYNTGNIVTGSGNDAVQGTGNDSYGGSVGILNTNASGIWAIAPTEVEEDAIIDTGNGNDTIRGTGSLIGINNTSIISTGAGNDNVFGQSTSSESSAGIINKSFGVDAIISTGSGNDTVSGTGGAAGIDNGADVEDIESIIDTGSGNDIVEGFGLNGIVNSCDILTGSGNDVVRGATTNLDLGFGIVNIGIIDTGSGNDTVDALVGGFTGGGEIFLGSGNDTLKGYGSGLFDGGSGTDKVLLGKGEYIVKENDDGFTIQEFEDVSPLMSITDFEKIGGSSSGLFNLQAGVLSVDASGVATFNLPPV